MWKLTGLCLGGFTASGDLDLLDSRSVKDATRLEEADFLLAVVMDDGLHLRVANGLKLDIKLTLGDIAEGDGRD